MNTARTLPFAQAWKSTFSFAEYARVPQWQRLVVTLLFSMAIAVPFTLLGLVFYGIGAHGWGELSGWIAWYGRNLVVALSIGLTIHVLYYLLYVWLGPRRIMAWSFAKRRAFFSLVPLLGVAIGWPLGLVLVGIDLMQHLGVRDTNALARTLLLAALISFVFNAIFSAKARQVEAERQATEAQLRLLQGQIEPHFLFNTLANVESLMDHDLPKARQMLHDFSNYLRASLGTLRNEQGPLSQELDLAENYLRLLAARMEDRLQWHIDADAAARAVQVPPLLLQPLVENAIQHGVEPQLNGGTVNISARLQGGQLVLEVHDDGCGPDAPRRSGSRAGHGVALKNIRERLQSRYGQGASLELTAANPGTRAVLRLPVEPASTP